MKFEAGCYDRFFWPIFEGHFGEQTEAKIGQENISALKEKEGFGKLLGYYDELILLHDRGQPPTPCGLRRARGKLLEDQIFFWVRAPRFLR